MNTQASRGTALTVFACLIAVLALSNFLKPVPVTSDTGFVLFGERLAGMPSAVAGAIFGVILLIYAFGIWRLRRWALPLGYAYSAYVIVNSILFRLRYPIPAETVGRMFEIGYAIVAVGGAVTLVALLSSRKGDLA